MLVEKKYSELTLEELYGILRLRAEVFLEDGIPHKEMTLYLQ